MAPVDMVGRTGTPGHISSVIRVIAPSTSSVIGDGGLGVVSAFGSTVTPNGRASS